MEQGEGDSRRHTEMPRVAGAARGHTEKPGEKRQGRGIQADTEEPRASREGARRPKNGLEGDAQSLRAGGQKEGLRGKEKEMEVWIVQWRSGPQGTP